MKAVLDKKQVVLLVPTTVLALKHYHSFKKRYENFPVNINFISRFKTMKQKSEVMSEVTEGKVDILIGTHSVLSDKLEFHDLGLLIIDEEHRFGVAHKEKLKLLKTGVDVLTMTATPIPRTLQLSFLGIRGPLPYSNCSTKKTSNKNKDLLQIGSSHQLFVWLLKVSYPTKI